MYMYMTRTVFTLGHFRGGSCIQIKVLVLLIERKTNMTNDNHTLVNLILTLKMYTMGLKYIAFTCLSFFIHICS